MRKHHSTASEPRNCGHSPGLLGARWGGHIPKAGGSHSSEALCEGRGLHFLLFFPPFTLHGVGATSWTRACPSFGTHLSLTSGSPISTPNSPLAAWAPPAEPTRPLYPSRASLLLCHPITLGSTLISSSWISNEGVGCSPLALSFGNPREHQALLELDWSVCISQGSGAGLDAGSPVHREAHMPTSAGEMRFQHWGFSLLRRALKLARLQTPIFLGSRGHPQATGEQVAKWDPKSGALRGVGENPEEREERPPTALQKGSPRSQCSPSLAPRSPFGVRGDSLGPWSRAI